MEFISIERNEPMIWSYHFHPLSDQERHFLEAVLMEEIELQCWFVVACSELIGGEFFVVVQ